MPLYLARITPPSINARRRGDTSLYLGSDGVSATTTGTLTIDNLYAMPFSTTQSLPLTHIGFKVTTGVASSHARAGIYTDSGSLTTSNIPYQLLVDGGEQDTSSTGAKESTISLTLQPGNYWLVLHTSAAIGTTVNTTGFPPLGFASDQTTPRRYIGANFTYQALLADLVAAGQTFTATSGVNPFVWVRA